MERMEIVLLGHMGRDEAAVDRLVQAGHKVHGLGAWENPGLVEKIEGSGGQFRIINSITNIEFFADFVEHVQPDLAFTNFDDSLAAGAKDAIARRVADGRIRDLWLPFPDQETARIESDKFYLRELVEEIDPKYNPLNFMVITLGDTIEALNFMESEGIEVAIKPRNLTGGKGVKVMGPHLRSYGDNGSGNERPSALEYAMQVLSDKKQTGLEIQEKLVGHEFTLQIFTDGTTIIKPPATYDYPYRKDGDTGPGTGGMGTFSMKDGLLPFLTQEDYDEAINLMERLLGKLKERGHDYKGVLYPTFFKTADGLKIVEVNARGGDPELVNIIDLMEEDVDLAEVLSLIAEGDLAPDSVRYKKMASAMLYLVSPEYGYKKGPSYEFGLYPETIAATGCNIRFAAAERIAACKYQTVGSSRTVGLSALGETPWEARSKIHVAINDGFDSYLPLEYRNQVAEKTYIKNLTTPE